MIFSRCVCIFPMFVQVCGRVRLCFPLVGLAMSNGLTVSFWVSLGVSKGLHVSLPCVWVHLSVWVYLFLCLAVSDDPSVSPLCMSMCILFDCMNLSIFIQV